MWFQNLSYVQQNIFLMDMTLKQNIILTSDDKTDVKKFDEIVNTLKLEDVFTKLPDASSIQIATIFFGALSPPNSLVVVETERVPSV